MMLNGSAAVLAGVTLGALSAAHCTLMCGPVALLGRSRSGATFPYFVGRLGAYVALGTLAGGVGDALLRSPWAKQIERGVTLALALLLLWSAWRALMGKSAASALQLGKKPRRAGWSRVLAHVAHEPLLLGAATALLPCATLFAAVAAAAATGSALSGALFMLSFALLTGAAVVGFGSVLATRFMQRWQRGIMTVAFLVGALLLLMRPLTAEPDAPDAPCPLHAGGAR